MDDDKSLKHVICFLENNARVITTSDVSMYEGMPGILIDPDMTEVLGYPPHHWKIQKGKIVLHSMEERMKRDTYHFNQGRDWTHELEKFFIKTKQELRLVHMAAIGASTLVVLLSALLIWSTIR